VVDEMALRPSPAGRGWALWSLPARAVAVVLTVEAVAVAVVLSSAVTPLPGEAALAVFVVLLSVVHTELATGIERIRRRTAATSYFDLSSVWTFAAALLLPTLLTAGVVVAVYTHLWRRVWRPAKVALHRQVYTTATVVLAAAAAHTAVRSVGGLPEGPDDLGGIFAIGLAILSYITVSTTLVAGAISLSSGPTGLRDLFGRLDDNVLKIATLCMGALAAVALTAAPGLVALALPPILVLHRAVLVRHLEQVASTDSKTGLLTNAAWRTEAARTVGRMQRASRAVAVLILDLDHFKTVNDVHGHLAGDDVLAAVATQLRTGVREHDVVGRFGGEEFVVLLRDLPTGQAGRTEMFAVAERLRRRIAGLDVVVDTADGVLTVNGLSISVGGAAFPADGAALEQVMRVADASLYAAKRAGRNLVRIAGPAEIPTPRSGS